MMKRLLAIFILFFSVFAFAQDQFADIGTRKYDTRKHLLIEPQAPVLPAIELPMSNNAAAVFKAVKPMSTKEELYGALAKLKETYKPFLQNLAPVPALTRKQIVLNAFNWRIETPDDISNFTGTLKGEGKWTSVNIPHFGPPLGRAVTYYYKQIDVAKEYLNDKLFICFKGVDYKASIFLNGRYIGSHEGFFAPFEFDLTSVVHQRKNQLLIKVENDFTTFGGKDDQGNHVVGDKIYATTGVGYDDPVLGWHQCPAGMGIYQDCYLETRSSIHINDLYVRPLTNQSSAEAWIEVNNLEQYPAKVKLLLSVYGQNFTDTVFENKEYIPSTTYVPGVGDLAKPSDWSVSVLKMGYGTNYLKVPIQFKNFRTWTSQTPWLYQLQVRVLDSNNKVVDTRIQQFGMRSFTMDTLNIPKGKMFLNGEMVRLRGANSMGFEQQDVMKKNYNQLVDDILLAKLCNLNYLRFTQRPVQPEVYDMCDKLGMLNQTDLPLFGSLRRNQFAQAVKQAEEMERLVRSHPSNIMVTYINERFPNAEGNPERSLNTAEEYYHLFSALDQAVLLNNPDRVIKSGDGDYDPPSPGLPDNHCYNTWYNGHGLGLGKMYKGYWQLVKPDWYYGCGEFGAEGLDPINVMQKYYPAAWLPSTKEEEKSWTANRISQSQTHRFHYMWYNTQHSVQDWIDASQDHQAWSMKFVAESFRRDPRMMSFAVHLFIDAWPAGWMKSIMDVDRQPKKAFFTYRNALEPLMVSLRCDRNKFFSGETTAIEAWICNDLNTVPNNYTLQYQIEKDGHAIMANKISAVIPINSSQFQGFLKYEAPVVKQRTKFTCRAAIMNDKGESIYQNEFEFEVFPKNNSSKKKIFVAASKDGNAYRVAAQAGYQSTSSAKEADVILIDQFDKYETDSVEMNNWVRGGKKILFLELPAKQYTIAATNVTIDKTAMGDYYFVSPATNHNLVKGYQPFDFHLWYSGKDSCIMPLVAYTINAPGWESILSSGNSNWVADKGPVMAASQLKLGKGVFRICELEFLDRLPYNPTAAKFFDDLINN
jgi:hypothetical protein